MFLYSGRKSKSNSISSEDSFASCASFPYSEVILKSDGSRSVTPSIASDRLSRDDLDQFYAQAEAHRSTNSLLDVPTASGLSQSVSLFYYKLKMQSGKQFNSIPVCLALMFLWSVRKWSD